MAASFWQLFSEKYLNNEKMTPKAKPIKYDEEVQQNLDEHIDQDFPGFPHAPSERKHINPKTVSEKIVAGIIKKPFNKDLNIK